MRVLPNNGIQRPTFRAAADAERSMRADQAQTSTDVMKANPEPKPSVNEPLVGLLFWEIIL
jgi:hypothetical protein